MSHGTENFPMKTKSKKTIEKGRVSAVGSGRLVRRLMKLVTEDGKFAYGTPTRCLDVVEHVFASHRRMCDNLQTLVQKHNLGDAGLPVDEIVCAELAKYLRFPPPVDNAFVAPGCEPFASPNTKVTHDPLGGRCV